MSGNGSADPDTAAAAPRGPACWGAPEHLRLLGALAGLLALGPGVRTGPPGHGWTPRPRAGLGVSPPGVWARAGGGSTEGAPAFLWGISHGEAGSLVPGV